MRKLQISIGIIIALACTAFIKGGNAPNKSPSKVKPLEIVNTSLTPEEIFIKKHPKRELRSAWITTFTNLY